MPSVTTWTRLEIGTRNADPGPGLEARVHDPLWTLGRQWQLGEFAAVDGGTPTIATLTVNQAPVDRFRAGSARRRAERRSGEGWPGCADRAADRARSAACPTCACGPSSGATSCAR